MWNYVKTQLKWRPFSVQLGGTRQHVMMRGETFLRDSPEGVRKGQIEVYRNAVISKNF